MHNFWLNLKVWMENSFLSFHCPLSPSAWTTGVRTAAIVSQVNKDHTQGWKGHRMEGVFIPLPCSVETTMLALHHILGRVTGSRAKSVLGFLFVCLSVLEATLQS